MKFIDDRPYAKPEAAACKLVEIAEPAQEDRIFIELVNWPFLTEFKGSLAGEPSACPARPIDNLPHPARSFESWGLGIS